MSRALRLTEAQIRRPQRKSDLPGTFLNAWRALAPHWSPPIREYRFHPVRKWRFDLAFVESRVAIEIDGAVYAQGRHSRGAGIDADNQKINAACGLGWRVLRFSSTVLARRPLDCVETVKEALAWEVGGEA